MTATLEKDWQGSTASAKAPTEAMKKCQTATPEKTPEKAAAPKLVRLDMAAQVKGFLQTLQEQAQVQQARILSLEHGNTPRPPEAIRGGPADQEVVRITFVVPRFTPQ